MKSLGVALLSEMTTKGSGAFASVEQSAMSYLTAQSVSQ